MLFLTSVFANLVLPALVFCSPVVFHNRQEIGGSNTRNYIVGLKDGAPLASVLGLLDGLGITYSDLSIINGFSGPLDDVSLTILRASPDVDYIAEDGIVSIFGTQTQTNAPWGVARLSQSNRLTNQNTNSLSFSYTYDSSAGGGVDIYILGVRTTHVQFGGRARWGATFGGYIDADENGHGTHVAGTAAASQFGVAKAVNIIAVKVLSDNGTGAVSDIVAGMNWVAASVQASGRPSIASLSLGGSANTAFDNAATALVNMGIHVTVAAGNGNTDAERTSPARAAGVVTVGASTIGDARASFSNYGSVVDIFAPGDNIISCFKDSDTATPHVAGLIAYLIGLGGNKSPQAMISQINSLSISGVLSGVREFILLLTPKK
ncbi:hypothetical protein H0H81_003091 [Sphagnurus paluster]|uniref:Peptidase S8/S53 domain-containing protein n=1 Tax=Sphagnurus paluster TaxID=117069 RepID=A0A9P7FV39_9AGAR|nr:hypothetical protein H0H81_003091 [Sphagnurus paluster]